MVFHHKFDLGKNRAKQSAKAAAGSWAILILSLSYRRGFVGQINLRSIYEKISGGTYVIKASCEEFLVLRITSL
jgi:hypothetical protein